MVEGLAQHWPLGLLLAVGLVAGFVNVVAGGGSLLTMPVMIFLGFSPATANGTNRVALVAQNLTAVSTFRRRGFSDFRLSLTLGLCTLPGAIAGAVAAVEIDPEWFKRLLAVVMVAVLISTLFGGKREPVEGDDSADGAGRWRLIGAHLGMLGVGFYGGFIQAGVGFILMALLQRLLRLDLVRVNMHKVFIVGTYMLPSLLVFAVLDEVEWLSGAALAIGNALGGWLGTRAQLSRGETIIKVIFALALVAMVIKLLLD